MESMCILENYEWYICELSHGEVVQVVSGPCPKCMMNNSLKTWALTRKQEEGYFCVMHVAEVPKRLLGEHQARVDSMRGSLQTV